MDLKNDLNHVADQYLNEILNILNFVRTTEKSLTLKKKKNLKNANKESYIKEIHKIIEFFAQEGKAKKDIRSLTIKSKSFGQFLFSHLISMTHKKFLNEMTLSYLISYQEAFIKDYLFQILKNKKVMIKSGTKITYEELLNYNSMKALTEALAQKEVDAIGYGSIDDIKEYFDKRFNIDLSQFANWKWLREATYRRNLIVHNRGETNDLYCMKTGFKSKGKYLETKDDYIEKSTQTIMDFIKYVHKNILIKLKLEKPRKQPSAPPALS